MPSIKKHRVKGHLYYALEQSYWDKSEQKTKRHYIAYLGSSKRVSAYGLPHRRPAAGWSKTHQTNIYEIAEYRNRETLLSKKAQKEAPKPKPTKRRRKYRPRKRSYPVKRKRLTGAEVAALKKFLINRAPELQDYPIEDEIDNSLTYDENKTMLANRYLGTGWQVEKLSEKEIDEIYQGRGSLGDMGSSLGWQEMAYDFLE